MARQNIDSKNPPILWDTVKTAFDNINNNFTELYLSVGEGSPVDLTSLSTSIIPSETLIYDLGSETKRWKDLYLGGSSLYLGDAVVTADGSALNLPEGSTVGGQLIKNPVDASFKTIAIPGQSSIVADNTSDTLNLVGTGISLTTNATSDTLTISNAGVTRALAGSGISVNVDVGDVTITNVGIINAVADTGIAITRVGGDITIANNGVVSVTTDPGSGIALDTSVPGVVRITNNAPNVVQNLWRYFNVPGQQILEADNSLDTLTVAFGTGLSITTNATTDTMTFTNTGVTSLAGSTGISVSNSTGSIILTNTGVTELIAGEGISVSSNTGNITIANTANKFSSIAVQGESPLLADNTTDTVTLIAGIGIVMTTDPSTDSITISAGGDSQSSIFSLGSTLLVDAENGLLVGDVITDIAKADIGVFGDKTQGNLGYKLHVIGDAGISSGGLYITNGDIFLNNNSINDANLNNATGDFFGNVWAADSTLLVNWETGNIVGPITTNYNIIVEANDAILEFQGTGTNSITADNGNLTISASTDVEINGTSTLNLIGSAINLGVNGTDQVTIGDTGGVPLILKSRAPVTSKGQSGDKAGMVAFSNTAIYFCKADWVSPGTADIWNRQTFQFAGVW